MACPHALLRGDAPDPVPREFRKPQVAIGPGRDEFRPSSRGERELGDGPVGLIRPTLFLGTQPVVREVSSEQPIPGLCTLGLAAT